MVPPERIHGDRDPPATADNEQATPDKPAKAKPIILLCAAPGTKLSTVTHLLETSGKVETWDLELKIRETFIDSEGQQPPDMQLVATYDRRLLCSRWKQAYRTVLEEMAGTKRKEKRVVCLHLTWYNPNWKEFFSPINIPSFINDGFPVEHIIVLLDDVYDMFVRLTKEGHLYEDTEIDSTVKNIGKLSAVPPASGVLGLGSLLERARGRMTGNSAVRQEQHRSEARELALTELMSWRRSEMITAENIARTLGCEVTFLGLKHTQESLKQLVSAPAVPRIYLSHRISEARRNNMSSRSRAEPEGRWEPLAREVNELHIRLAEKKAVLINPTAIDELRFDNDRKTRRRNPKLAPRWPLPDRDEQPLLWDYVVPDEDADKVFVETAKEVEDVNHEAIFLGGLPQGDEVASHAARTLSNQIYAEIPLRDHFIVENTPNLCVYRPFFCGKSSRDNPKVTWSGGVEAELNHWKAYFAEDRMGAAGSPSQNAGQFSEEASESGAPAASQPYQKRRIAFVHTDVEIRERVRYLTLEKIRGSDNADCLSFHDAFRRYIGSYSARMGTLVAGSGGTFMEASELPDVVRNNPTEYLEAVRSASLKILYYIFSDIDMREGAFDLLLIPVEEHPGQRVKGFGQLAKTMKRFFGGKLDEGQILAENDKFCRQVRAEFVSLTGQNELQYGSQLFNVDFDTVRVRSGHGNREL